MAGSYSSESVDFLGSQQKVDCHKALSFVGNEKARHEFALEPTELQSRDQYYRLRLLSTPCDRHQFLEMEQRTEDRYDFAGGSSVLRVGVVGDGDHTSLTGTLFELESSVQVQWRRAQSHSMPGVKMRLTKEAATLPKGQKVARGSMASGPSSSSVSEKSAVGGISQERRRMGKGNETRFGELEGDRSTEAGCH